MKALSKASGCVIGSVGEIVFLTGSKEQRDRAEDYIRLTMSMIRSDLRDHVDDMFVKRRDDRTILEIPARDVAYILGKSRETMNFLEDEFNIVLAFHQDDHDLMTEPHRLAIFGSPRGRLCAQVEIMSSVENNDPGTFTTNCTALRSPLLDVAIDRIPYTDTRDVGCIIGKDGCNLTRLSRASGAFVQFVGHILHITGTQEERTRARDYIGFHLEGHGRLHQLRFNASGRGDVMTVKIDGSYLEGPEVWKIENESGTFCFQALDDKGTKQFFIFGGQEGERDSAGGGSGRAKAAKMVKHCLRDRHKAQWSGARNSARSRSPRANGHGKDSNGQSAQWRRRDWHEKQYW